MTKPAKCKVCQCAYTKIRPMQKVCSPMCALELSKTIQKKIIAKKAQEDRKKTREKLDAMRTKPQLVKVAQTAFNAFVRARDADKPCISCGKPPSTETNQTDAGHFRSVGSAPHMRFVEDNCHGQCKHCNQYLAGNVLAYRKGLIERIGLERVEQIESDQTVRKYTKEGLQEIAKHYNAETRRLKKDAK
jgi:Bacteriophage Lambda NinG protein